VGRFLPKLFWGQKLSEKWKAKSENLAQYLIKKGRKKHVK
jgi:hypothetical protein